MHSDPFKQLFILIRYGLIVLFHLLCLKADTVVIVL